jgi:hypothetical protein
MIMPLDSHLIQNGLWIRIVLFCWMQISNWKEARAKRIHRISWQHESLCLKCDSGFFNQSSLKKVPHPPCLPDLASYCYCQFEKVKGELVRRWFGNGQQPFDMVMAILDALSTS